MSALILAVWAASPIPMGPAATPASTPSLKLFDWNAATPRSVITRRTTSADCAPACSPKLAPPTEKKAGPFQLLSVSLARKTPFPPDAPKMKAAFSWTRHDKDPLRVLQRIAHGPHIRVVHEILEGEMGFLGELLGGDSVRIVRRHFNLGPAGALDDAQEMSAAAITARKMNLNIE